MRHIFVTHTPYLLEEFPLNGMVWKHQDRTSARTLLLSETLRSLGRTVRVNLTLWLVATEHSVEEVHNRIQECLKPHVSLDRAGDIFVIEAGDVVGTTSQDTVAQCQTILGVSSTQPMDSLASTSVATAGDKRVPQDGRASKREQIAEDYGVKPTDAMFRRLPGSYGGGKR